ncbi:MAG: right-handed parallel beta-helix repeat-containing protein [Lentisphaerae bacterium]|nr:right-handed parallel beta-helix repeat-containing protein [Lentisphaerota bacterium]
MRIAFGTTRGGLTLAALWLAAGAAGAQTLSTVATFNNIGVELTFPSAPPAGTTVSLFIREADSTDPYRPGHPLARITSTTFAGCAFWLDPGTAYALRLESPALPANLFTTASTRRDQFATPAGTTYYVDPATGNDANNGLTTAKAYRTLGKALTQLAAGRQIVLRGGRYREGDYEINAAGTPAAPIEIRNMAGEQPVLDGTDTNFVPAWALHDAAANLYRTPCTRLPNRAFLNGEQFFHYSTYADLKNNLWSQGSGFVTDGTNLYARFPGNAAPGTNVLTIPKFTVGLTLNATVHDLMIIGLEFRQYGFQSSPKGIYLNGADSNLIERCAFWHVGSGIGIKRDATFNTVQNCFFSESPLSRWSWNAVKNNPDFSFEAGGIVIYGSTNVNEANVIRFNTFSNMFDGSFLYSTLAAGPTKHMDFHDNHLMDCADDGIETDGFGSNVRIYANTFRDFLSGISVAPCTPGPTYIMRNVMAGSPAFGADARLPIKFNVGGLLTNQWIYLYHNTFSTDVTGQDGFIMYSYSKWTNVISRNNIYAGQRYAFYSTADPNPIDFDYDNLYDASGAPFARWKSLPYNTFAQFQAASGQELHGWSVDPGFTNAPAQDFRLLPGSAMIDLGISIPGVNDDFIGRAPDVGAFEFGSTAMAMSVASNSATVIWRTGERGALQMDATTDLLHPAWTAAGSAASTLTYRVLCTDPASTPTPRYYRLRRLIP